MNMNRIKLLLPILCILTSVIVAGQFELAESSNSSAILVFNIGDITFENVEDYSRIIEHNSGTLMEEGMPEIPVFSTFYQVFDGVEYDIDYIVHQSHIIENITLY